MPDRWDQAVRFSWPCDCCGRHRECAVIAATRRGLVEALRVCRSCFDAEAWTLPALGEQLDLGDVA